MGLIKALDRYDVADKRKATFQTYAYYWVFQAVYRYANTQRLIKIPEYVVNERPGFYIHVKSIEQGIGNRNDYDDYYGGGESLQL